jgi:hypothetical protein
MSFASVFIRDVNLNSFDVFVWLWYQGYIGLIKLLGSSLLLHF